MVDKKLSILVADCGSKTKMEMLLSTENYNLTHSSWMQHPCCITLSYRMVHPCVVRCLHTNAVLIVCMNKLVCHMIKQSSRIGNSPDSQSLSIKPRFKFGTSSMTHLQYFHVIFHVLLPIIAPDITTVNGMAKTSYLVHIEMC